MDGNLNRRAALGALGAVAGLAASVGGADLPQALPSPPQPPGGGAGGVRGRMTGARAAALALRCECVPCVFGVPGAQNNEFWDAMKSAGQPYLLVTNEASASVMADGASRATGGVGVFSVVPGPGMTNSLTGIGEALLDSVPIVGIVTDVDRRPGGPCVPGPLDAQRGRAPGDLQGGDRGPPPGRDPVPDPRGVPGRRQRRARAGRRDPAVPAADRGLGLRRRGPPPLPRPVRRDRLSQGPGDPGRPQGQGRDLRGDGLPGRGPAPGLRRGDPPGTGGHLGQRQGGHPRRAPAGGGLGLRGPGDPGGGEGVPGGGRRARRRGQILRELDGQLRDPRAWPGDPRRRQPRQSRPERPDRRLHPRRLPPLLRPARPGRRRGFAGPATPPWPGGSPPTASSTAARTARSRSPRASTRCSSCSSSAAPWGPTS